MEFNKDQIYVFNPDYVLRNDIHRIVLYAKENINAYSSRNWNSFIHPVQAELFSFFTYDRTLEENIRLIASYFKSEADAVIRWIMPFIENQNPIYSRWNNKRINFPKQVLIKKERLSKELPFSYLKTTDFMCESIDLDTRRYYSGPLLVTFMLNNTCVTNCKYCYADIKTQVKNPLPTKRWISLIQEAKLLQVRQINLMGGEIFLHKDWDVILKELVTLEMAPDYLSTKIPLTEKLINRLLETGYINNLQVSLDAYNTTVLINSLSVGSKYLNEMEKGLRILDESGIKFHISTVLHQYNGKESELHRLFDFLNSLSHLKNWRITPVVNSIMIDNKVFAPLKLRRERIEEIFRYIEKHLLPNSSFPILLNRTSIDKTYYCCNTGSQGFEGAVCSALNTHLFILPDGHATICEQLYWNPKFIIGNTQQATLKEIWQSERSFKLANLQRPDIQNESPCKSCQLFDSCYKNRNRCWAEIIKAYGENNWDFPDPRCFKAQEMINNLEY